MIPASADWIAEHDSPLPWTELEKIVRRQAREKKILRARLVHFHELGRGKVGPHEVIQLTKMV